LPGARIGLRFIQTSVQFDQKPFAGHLEWKYRPVNQPNEIQSLELCAELWQQIVKT